MIDTLRFNKRALQVGPVNRQRTSTMGWLAAALLISGCGMTVDNQEAITTLLQCTECADGELDAVLEYANRRFASRNTVLVLETALLNSLPPQQLESLKEAYRSSHQRLVAHSQREGKAVATDEQTYVERFIDNATALRKVRAAHALATIGGEYAKAALDSAITHPPLSATNRRYEQVMESILFARDSIWTDTGMPLSTTPHIAAAILIAVVVGGGPTVSYLRRRRPNVSKQPTPQ